MPRRDLSSCLGGRGVGGWGGGVSLIELFIGSFYRFIVYAIGVKKGL